MTTFSTVKNDILGAYVAVIGKKDFDTKAQAYSAKHHAKNAAFNEVRRVLSQVDSMADMETYLRHGGRIERVVCQASQARDAAQKALTLGDGLRKAVLLCSVRHQMQEFCQTHPGMVGDGFTESRSLELALHLCMLNGVANKAYETVKATLVPDEHGSFSIQYSK